MRILALETVEKAGSLALLVGTDVLVNLQLSSTQRSAQSLAPAIREAFQVVGWTPRDLELIAVTIGPGSFTGLRVGVTTAKTLAYAAGAGVMGLNTLEVIACQAEQPVERLQVILDAQRGELFAAEFTCPTVGVAECLTPAHIIEAGTWLNELSTGIVVTGPALAKLADRLPAGVRALPSSAWAPQASTVGRMAARAAAGGRRDDLWKLVPLYLRQSAAEEKLERK